MKFSLLFTIAFIAFTVEAELTADQKRRCEQFISIFENDTIELQYAYVENINDGRGYTAGRAGFTTGTGDAYVVIKAYTAQKADNPLAKYLSELEKLAKSESGDVKNLSGFPAAWKEAAKDALFRQIQDQVVDDMYYKPAIKLADKSNVKTALGQCEFYDTIIQHGDGDDQDSINAIIKKTQSVEGGVVKDNEKVWIREFMKERRADLVNPHNKATQQEWKGSVDRVDAMVKLLDDGNMDLKGPIHVKTPEHDLTIP